MVTYQQEYVLVMGTYMLPLYDALVIGTYMLPLYGVLEASRPTIGVRSACYWRTTSLLSAYDRLWRVVLIIIYSCVNYLINTKRGGAVLIQ